MINANALTALIDRESLAGKLAVGACRDAEYHAELIPLDAQGALPGARKILRKG